MAVGEDWIGEERDWGRKMRSRGNSLAERRRDSVMMERKDRVPNIELKQKPQVSFEHKP